MVFVIMPVHDVSCGRPDRGYSANDVRLTKDQKPMKQMFRILLLNLLKNIRSWRAIAVVGGFAIEVYSCYALKQPGSYPVCRRQSLAGDDRLRSGADRNFA